MKIHWQQILRAEDVTLRYHGASKVWEPNGDGPLFVQLWSRSDALNHQRFDSLIGKTVKITVETLD